MESFYETIEKIIIPQVYLPIIYIIVAYIINKLLKKLSDNIIFKKQRDFQKSSYHYKKIETYKVLIQNIIKYCIIIFTVLAILPIYGVDVTSIVAGIGVFGAVIGLAFQDVAKDLIAGLSIIIENQFAIGDTISVGNFKGEVIYLGLKTTRIRNYEGQIKIISNRNITEVINYSIAYSMAIVDVSVSYESNLDKVEQTLKELSEELTNSLPNLKGNVEVLGLESLSSSSIEYRMVAKTSSMNHFTVQRLMRKAIKDRLEKAKIKIPYQQIEVHDGK